MIQQLKFRAWNDTRYFYSNDTTEFPEMWMFWRFICRNRLQVERHIGRRDVNDKDIYENDITDEGVVEWCERLAWDSGGSLHPGFYFKDKYDLDERGELKYHVGFDDVEIFGNVNENPELLK